MVNQRLLQLHINVHNFGMGCLTITYRFNFRCPHTFGHIFYTSSCWTHARLGHTLREKLQTSQIVIYKANTKWHPLPPVSCRPPVWVPEGGMCHLKAFYWQSNKQEGRQMEKDRDIKQTMMDQFIPCLLSLFQWNSVRFSSLAALLERCREAIGCQSRRWQNEFHTEQYQTRTDDRASTYSAFSIVVSFSESTPLNYTLTLNQHK